MTTATVFVGGVRQARGACDCGEHVELERRRDLEAWHAQHLIELERELPPITERGSA